jgi:DNA-binding IclR family transcriptional regulator
MSRLLTVLQSRGYVEQVSGRGKYRLGWPVPAVRASIW